MKEENLSNLQQRCAAYFDNCRVGNSFAFKPFLESQNTTLYSSVFAVMTYHYAGELGRFSDSEKSQWANYILSFQSTDTGLFDSDELHDGVGEYHNLEHRQLHLTCHVLPALSLLDVTLFQPIKYTERFLNRDSFLKWLDQRDLAMAWVEGNNLLFAGQLLIYEMESNNRGHESIELLFQWLEDKVDPSTALWGTNQGCTLHKAMYGAYHQLILYFYQNRKVPYIEKLIDSVISCQHLDGGFSEWRGGGTCQDIDGIDILVNCYKLTDYRKGEIRYSLRKALHHILEDRAVPSGGFMDIAGYEFVHNSMPATRTPVNRANSFSTWFTLHAIVGIGSVLHQDRFYKNGKSEFNFNNSCSMGWGKADINKSYVLTESMWDDAKFILSRVVVALYDAYQRFKK